MQLKGRAYIYSLMLLGLFVLCTNGEEFIGCYEYQTSSESPLVLKDEMMDITKCIQKCIDTFFAGVQNDSCYCFSSLLDIGKLKNKRFCNLICPGSNDEMCGGLMHISIFNTTCSVTTMYGAQCNQECGCGGGCFTSGMCRIATDTCKAGFRADSSGLCQAQECMPGTFGINCESTCHCSTIEECDTIDGRCENQCAEGWVEFPYCQISMEVQNNSSAVNQAPSLSIPIGVSLLGIFVLTAITILIYRFRCKRKDNIYENTKPVQYNKPKTTSTLPAYDPSAVFDDTNDYEEVMIKSRDSHISFPGNRQSVYSNMSTTRKSRHKKHYHTFNDDAVESFPPEFFEKMETKTIAIDSLEQVIQNMKHNESIFKDEYALLPPHPIAPSTVGNNQLLKKKNHFKNIIPYDHSRVQLSEIDKDPLTDYINASYIQTYHEQIFIACQGPIQETLEDFWRMIWEQECCIIVMLSNLDVDSKKKSRVYYPEDIGDESTFGPFSIKMLEKKVLPDFTVRQLELYVQTGGQPRQVTHMHFTSWVDKSPPKQASPLLNFRHQVRTLMEKQDAPVVVHCVAGVGRSGTFIALDNLLDQVKYKKEVNVFKTVFNLRKRRVQMVQVLQQYIFIHEALLEHVALGETAIKSSNFKEIYQGMNIPEGVSGKTKLKKHLEILKVQQFPFGNNDFKSARSKENIGKHRDKKIMAADKVRAFLGTPVDGRSNYINAVFVQGYRNDTSIISTQLPMRDTRVDFWRLVYDFNISVIVSLWPSIGREGTGNEPYWPEPNSIINEGPFYIKRHESTVISSIFKTKIEGIEEMRLDVKYTQKHFNDVPKQVYLLRLIWAPGAYLPPTDRLIKLQHCVERMQQKDATLRNQSPILVQCFDGSERCGIFSAINFIVDMMNAEREVDIFQVVKQLQLSRHEFIEDEKLYQYLYDFTEAYLKSFESYSNFTE